jgi:hypothetical protein
MMVTAIVRTSIAATCFAMVLVFASSGCKESKRPPPPRPPGVPSDAVWVGGYEFGGFFGCTPQSETTAKCTVWDDDSTVPASAWMKGWFRLVPGKSGPDHLRGDLHFHGADGDRIYLEGDAYLEVIPPPRPSGVPSDAHWSGGPQCGSFIGCTKEPTRRRRFYCTVYNEDDGTILHRGSYKLVGDVGEGPQSNDDLEESCAIKEWDISVRGGGLLVPLANTRESPARE